jgi:hypothetical protein
MSLFQPSTKAVSAAAQEIADTVGASGDGEMTTRAGRSLFAALQHFNNMANWDFLRTEATPITVFAPFGVGGVSAHAGIASAACPAGHGLKIDDFVTGPFFNPGTRVSATAAGGFGIFGTIAGVSTADVFGSATAIRDMYDLPGDWKAPYTMRTLGNNAPLNYIGRRTYDRGGANEQTTSTPYWYDLLMVGSRGKIRLLPPPTGADTLLMRYYRRMTIPSTTATADVVDIVQDYEPYLIAWAKWHFLLDKGEGRGDQMKTWFVMSQDGLKTMLRSQTVIPDDGLMFLPGHAAFGSWSDNSTRWIPWDMA